MPGATPYAAYAAFVTPLAKALACVARVKIQPSAGGKNNLLQDHNLYLTRQGDNDYVRLKGEPALELSARMVYRLIEDTRPGYGPYRATTKGYLYSLQLSDGRAIVDHHWHPGGSSDEQHPHLHVGAAQLRTDGVLSSKHHIPTGRVTLESVIRTAIELGARPLYDDWADRLMSTEEMHIRHRSWSADPSRAIVR